MKWTLEQRYRKLEEASQDELDHLTHKVEQCSWRQAFHIQPPMGLLNDPNGFAYYQGEYHLFYQWFPLGPVHGLKYWYHTKSKDLVHWDNLGIGISPDQDYDSHGAYSGSSLVKGDNLYIMYTGNTRDEDWVRHPYQCMAVMKPDGSIVKYDHPIISEVPAGYTEHFRDPKIWEADGKFYAVIGAQRNDLTGCALLYESLNLVEWKFRGEVHTSLGSFGYMWECPDYFEFGDHGILVICPQGLAEDKERFRNIYQAGYVLGDKLDLDSGILKHGNFRELDRGFDFYAPQTTMTPDGRRLMIAWMGLPDIDCPTAQNEWAHCMTLPRELKLQGNRLLQLPLPELVAMRGEQWESEDVLNNSRVSPVGFTGTKYEMICEFENNDAEAFGIEFRTGDRERTVLYCDAESGKLILDRTLSGTPTAVEYGMVRSCEMDMSQIKLQLFVDTSSVEVFVNDGEEVFTARIFPGEHSEGISFFSRGGQVAYRAEKWDYIGFN